MQFSDLTQDFTNPYSELTQGYYISCSIITYDSVKPGNILKYFFLSTRGLNPFETGEKIFKSGNFFELSGDALEYLGDFFNLLGIKSWGFFLFFRGFLVLFRG